MAHSPIPTGPILVRKYGGSSLATVARIKTVAGDIRDARDRGYRLVVVVSAMGRTTDELNALAHEAHAKPPRRELDMLLSVGERITMSLLSMALADLDCPAISFTGSQCGIITDTSHSDARILEVRGDRVREALARGDIVVVAGYQGVSLEREITTLGRGGSDTTAVALAAALGAIRCEILKDVDGVLNADPRLVPAAARHDRLTWDEMRAVAESGCGVVHIRAVEYAAEHDVPLIVRSSFHDGPGTVIGTEPVTEPTAPARPASTAGPKSAHAGERYRPLVINVATDVTRVSLATPHPARGQAWRDLLREQLDPGSLITEWLDSGESFRWEGLTSQGDLESLREGLWPLATAETGAWQTGLTCVSLTGGRPDNWLAVHDHVRQVMSRMDRSDWRLRADGSALRLVFRAEVSPGEVQRLHRALLPD